ncbi:MAG: B12-binding domain-containing radical SAM protein [Candidatus Omnitrophica bacterium]|nr:B12-binding domain-containing radical SAM protein [Candidatus Omnitrophota bacterium]
MIAKVLIVVPPLVNKDEEGDAAPDRPDFEAYRLVSPVEPTSVAADLLHRGFTVKLFDLGAYTTGRFERYEAYLRDVQPDAVVLVQSILTFATAQDWDGKRVFELARHAVPHVLTVLTGGQATNYPGRAVEARICDYSIKGEVDFAVAELLTTLNQGGDPSGVRGVAFRTTSGEVFVSEGYPVVDVLQLRLPAYHVLDADQHLQYTQTLERAKIRFPEKSRRYRDIMTSRGCVLRCSFCCVAHLRGERQKYRRKPLDLVMAEIEQALEGGIEEIHFFDDLFVQNEAQILEFTDELRRRRLTFHWFVAQGQPLWPLTRDALAAMKETGMYRIICPLESGSNRVLKEVVGKVYSRAEHHHNVVRWAHELGLEIIGMFVVGMPGEKRHEILETVRFAEAHPEIDYSVFSIATPMVGTRLMRQVMREGRLDDQDKINRVIKRTVALYETEEFKAYEMGVIRAFDWDRINFPTLERQMKYTRMVGITLEQLDIVREYSKKTFYRFFPDYDGPLSFKELYEQPDLFKELEPLIPSTLY